MCDARTSAVLDDQLAGRARAEAAQLCALGWRMLNGRSAIWELRVTSRGHKSGHKRVLLRRLVRALPEASLVAYCLSGHDACGTADRLCQYSARRERGRPRGSPSVNDPRMPPERRVVDSEDRRHHLDLIQAAIGRMSSASTTAKGWMLPVATATYGYALTQNAESIAILGIAAVLLFGFLDTQYLRQERAFRALYRAAVEGKVAVYEMTNVPYYNKPNGDEEDRREENCQWGSVIRSWSVTHFYGPLVVVGIIVLVRAWMVSP